jgi:cytochrome P450
MNIIKGSANVRAAARDYEKYSSDLQGDQDVRDYKQLPLEVDPPHHTELRSLLNPWFSRDGVARLEPEFRKIAKTLISSFDKEVEVTHDLALQMIVQCLGVLFGRPQDVDEWFSWGPDTWITDEDGIRHGDHLDRYLKKTFDELDEHPTEDLFGILNTAEMAGRTLTRKEKYGMANLVLAGGRDTVVKLMSGSLWHLANNKEHLRTLKNEPERIPEFLNEMVRFLSPLPMMHRVDTEQTTNPDEPVYAWLSFVSANQDKEIFQDPEQIKLDRGANPHLGFGYGRHTCIGLHLAQLEAKIVLEEWFMRFSDWEILPTSEIFFDLEDYKFIPSRFHSLDLRITS